VRERERESKTKRKRAKRERERERERERGRRLVPKELCQNGSKIYRCSTHIQQLMLRQHAATDAATTCNEHKFQGSNYDNDMLDPC